MDAGEVYASVATPIDPLETAGELHDRLARLGAPAVLDVLARHAGGELRGEAQDESLATRAPKLSRADGWVDFNAGAAVVRNRIHGLTPWPGVTVRWQRMDSDESRPLLIRRVEAFPELRADAPPGTVLGDHWVATGRGAVRLIEVQAPGGKALAIEDFARGNRMRAGDRLIGGPALADEAAG
jgi:methionyl-tRNA formyltransferase